MNLKGKNNQGGCINDFYYCLCKNSEQSLGQEATFKKPLPEPRSQTVLDPLRSDVLEPEFP